MNRQLTALLLLVSLGLARAGEPPAGEPPKGGDAEKPKGPKYDWVLAFANGDRLHCRVHGLEGGVLSFSSRMAPGRRLSVEMAKVESLARIAVIKGGPLPWADALRLRNGSLFYGRFMGLTGEQLKFKVVDGDLATFPRAALRVLSTPAGSRQVRLTDGTVYRGRLLKRGEKLLEFDVEKIGTVKIPLEKVADLSAPAAPVRENLARPDAHVVITAEGDTLIGELKQAGDGSLLVRGRAVKASCDPDAVRAVLFPAREKKPSAARVEGKPVGVVLANGSTAVGYQPAIRDGRFSFTLARGGEMSLPLAAVARVSLTGELISLSGSRQILVWGRYSDRAEEFARAVTVLKKHLGKSHRIVENFSEHFDKSFQRELYRSRVLVVPELEKWGPSNPAALAAQFKPMAAAFLKRGGNIVFLGPESSQCTWLLQSGLMHLQRVNSTSSGSRAFLGTPAARQIARGIGAAFTASNSTILYRLGTSLPGQQVLAGSTTSSAVVARKAGRGWVIVMGMDFYERNASTEKLLVNAVNMK